MLNLIQEKFEGFKMNQKWNVGNYDKDFKFVSEYTKDLIGMIDKEGVNLVLDLGCGTGEHLKQLSEFGNVIGLDMDEEMLTKALKKNPEVDLVLADATNFELDEKVDVVFSSAVFHWIDKKDQLKMLKAINQNLNSGGQLVFEMGGYGNNDLIHATFKELFEEFGYEYIKPFYFPTIGEYANLLEEAGFKVTYAVLFDRFTPLKGPDGLKNWIKMFLNNPFEIVSEEDREDLIDKGVKKLKVHLFRNGQWFSDYVRLRMKAVKDQAI